jgi:prepilin-type N-terminal cleavage/methylation domain-containing protein
VLPCEPREKAFTLIELSVVLLLISLMVGFGIEAFQNNGSKNCYEATRLQERDIQTALESFARANNRLPLPAQKNIGINHPQFGREVTDTSLIVLVPGGTPTVYLGALPFSTLGLNSSYAADCWGNKFTYLVTRKLTDQTTYMNNDNTGTIRVMTGTVSVPTTLTDRAAYAVISHGQDALGASARNYSGAPKDCAAAPANRIDRENCDDADAIVYSAPFNDGSGAVNFFDDLVIYAGKTGYTGCNGATLSWDNCSAAIGDMGHAAVTNVVNTVGGYLGSATAACINGTLSLSNQSCCADANNDAACDVPSCLADGISSGGNPAACCNGDADGDGLCGGGGGGMWMNTGPGVCGDRNVLEVPPCSGKPGWSALNNPCPTLGVTCKYAVNNCAGGQQVVPVACQ